MADDREQGSQQGGQENQGGQRGQGGSQGGQAGQGGQRNREDDERSQRGTGPGREGERDTGTQDRGVERSDWNYGDPAEEEKGGQRSREKREDVETDE